MKANQKLWRKQFRDSVLERDNEECQICSYDGPLEVHHITDRNEMPNGGYVASNGIALCGGCHLKAEKFHMTRGKEHVEGFHPNDLYKIIGSSYEQAFEDSQQLS